MWFSPSAFLKTYMPTGLFPRSLLIIVMPVVVTETGTMIRAVRQEERERASEPRRPAQDV